MNEVDSLRSQIELNKIHISKVKKEADAASLADEITKKASVAEKQPSKEEDEYTEVASNAPTDTLKEALKETLNEPFPQVTQVYRFVHTVKIIAPLLASVKSDFDLRFNIWCQYLSLIIDRSL